METNTSCSEFYAKLERVRSEFNDRISNEPFVANFKATELFNLLMKIIKNNNIYTGRLVLPYYILEKIGGGNKVLQTMSKIKDIGVFDFELTDNDDIEIFIKDFDVSDQLVQHVTNEEIVVCDYDNF